jgi:hypothetical protein
MNNISHSQGEQWELRKQSIFWKTPVVKQNKLQNFIYHELSRDQANFGTNQTYSITPNCHNPYERSQTQNQYFKAEQTITK